MKTICECNACRGEENREWCENGPYWHEYAEELEDKLENYKDTLEAVEDQLSAANQVIVEQGQLEERYRKVSDDRIQELEGICKEAISWFDQYARQHLEKGSAEKAFRNRTRANIIHKIVYGNSREYDE